MHYDFLTLLGIKEVNYGATTGSSDGWLKTSGKELVSISPIDGKPIAKVIQRVEDLRRLLQTQGLIKPGVCLQLPARL
jgi:hypothetical protein